MLEIYETPGCPYCIRVRQKLDELGIEYLVHSEPSSHRERSQVKALSGQTYVPTLHDPERNVIIADDDDAIIAYLHKHYGHRPA